MNPLTSIHTTLSRRLAMKRPTSQLFTLVAIALFAAATSSQAATVNFQEGVAPSGAYAHDATYIRSTDPSGNNDGDPDLELIVGTTLTGDVVRTLLEFDISTIPAADNIDSASLVLTTRSTGGGLDQGGETGDPTFNLHNYGFDVVETVSTWDDPDGALQRYLDQRDDLHAGRTPRVSAEDLTVRDLLNRFLTAKRHLLDTGEIVRRTFLDYHATCQRIADTFGLTRLVDDLASDDFERLRADLAKTRGPVALGNEITRCRVVFKYAYDAGLVDKPVRYGPRFKRPSKRVLRKARNGNGPRMFEADEIRTMIDATGGQLRAMILLAANCGFGNNDVGTLPVKALDLTGGWVNYPRPKTGVPRRCPLWPETVSALQEAITSRPTAKDSADADPVFITKYGKRWAKDSTDNTLSKEFGKLIRKLGIRQPGRGFYGLRHTFQTIGEEGRDFPAVSHIMGHTQDDMASVYRERISDERLIAVTNYVREWLFGDHSGAGTRPAIGQS